jgi:hypothetical protein
MARESRGCLVQLAVRKVTIPGANSLPVRATESVIANGIVDAAIIKLRGVGVPLADALPVILRKQIKLANSGVLERKHFGKHLLKDVGNSLHLLTRHVPVSPFKEDIDVPAQHLDMKTNLALQFY